VAAVHAPAAGVPRVASLMAAVDAQLRALPLAELAAAAAVDVDKSAPYGTVFSLEGLLHYFFRQQWLALRWWRCGWQYSGWLLEWRLGGW
jgi:hypothetical protein